MTPDADVFISPAVLKFWAARFVSQMCENEIIVASAISEDDVQLLAVEFAAMVSATLMSDCHGQA